VDGGLKATASGSRIRSNTVDPVAAVHPKNASSAASGTMVLPIVWYRSALRAVEPVCDEHGFWAASHEGAVV
jgi:hypothetical protein